MAAVATEEDRTSATSHSSWWEEQARSPKSCLLYFISIINLFILVLEIEPMPFTRWASSLLLN